MMKCEFCERLALEKHWEKIENKTGLAKINHEYTVAFVTHAWYKSKRHASRSVDYRNKGLGYKLNFCPECGRQLKRGKIIVRQSDAILDYADKDDRRND